MILIDHKPYNLTAPWAIAFPLDHDALLEVQGARYDLPAGAVLVWTGTALDWYPASSSVRAAVIWPGDIPADLREGGTRVWS